MASSSTDPNNLLLKSVRRLKEKFPQLCVITDVAMDPYSSDGHDGYVHQGEILNADHELQETTSGRRQPHREIPVDEAGQDADGL